MRILMFLICLITISCKSKKDSSKNLNLYDENSYLFSYSDSIDDLTVFHKYYIHKYDNKHIMVISFWPNGNKQGYIFLKNGVKNGPFKMFYENGSFFIKGFYINNLHSDSEFIFKKNGSLKEINIYSKDSLIKNITYDNF